MTKLRATRTGQLIAASLLLLAMMAGMLSSAPQVAIAADDPDATDSRPGAETTPPKSAGSQIDIEGARDILNLAGIDESHFNRIEDGRPPGANDEETVLRILFRMGSFDPMSIARWTQREVDFKRLAGDPTEHRAEMFALVGRVKEIREASPPEEVVARFEIQHYYLCRAELGPDRQPATLICTQIPKTWPVGMPIDERISASGLFFKIGAEQNGTPTLVFLAKHIAWHPDTIREGGPGPQATFGMTTLGNLGMDVGLLDNVQNRRRIGQQEREAFYRMLWAVGRAGPKELVRNARLNLDRRVAQWQQEAATRTTDVKAMRTKLAEPPANSPERDDLVDALQLAERRLAIVRKSLNDAKEDRYSVYPLFNLPEEQHGRLVMLEGEARRAIKVKIGTASGRENNADILARFDMDHYYEVEIFTRDSQHNPIVFCVRQLPEGFPVGEDINEPVLIPGFFFKTWAYYTQQTLESAEDGQAGKKRQLAPLLIGKQPIWLTTEEAGQNPWIGVIAGVLFLGGILTIWLWLWRFNRSDREFHAKAIAKNYSVEEGASLDDLNLEAETEPDFSHLD